MAFQDTSYHSCQRSAQIRLSPLSPLSRPVSPLSFNDSSTMDVESVPTPPAKPEPVYKNSSVRGIRGSQSSVNCIIQIPYQPLVRPKKQRDKQAQSRKRLKWKRLTVSLILAIVALVAIGAGSVLVESVISMNGDKGSTSLPVADTKSTSGISLPTPMAATLNASSANLSPRSILPPSTTLSTIPTTLIRATGPGTSSGGSSRRGGMIHHQPFDRRPPTSSKLATTKLVPLTTEAMSRNNGI